MEATYMKGKVTAAGRGGGGPRVPPQLEEGRGVVPDEGPPPVDLARRLSIPRRKAKAVLDEGVDETELALKLTKVLSPVGGGAARWGRDLLRLRAGIPHAGLGVGIPAKRPRRKIEAGGFAAGRLCPGAKRGHRKEKSTQQTLESKIQVGDL